MKDEQDDFGMGATSREMVSLVVTTNGNPELFEIDAELLDDDETPRVTPGRGLDSQRAEIRDPRAPQYARDRAPDKSGGDRFGAAGAALWRAVVVDYELDSTESEILALACRALDRAARARAAVERDGEFITGRYGDLKAHPGMLVVRDAESAALRALRSLHLSGIDLTLSQLRAPKR